MDTPDTMDTVPIAEIFSMPKKTSKPDQEQPPPTKPEIPVQAPKPTPIQPKQPTLAQRRPSQNNAESPYDAVLEGLRGLPLEALLPRQISVERFHQTVITAVRKNPELLAMDRGSLFEASVRAAQDGLLPDGRDAVFVPFKGKIQYLPMVHGVIKRLLSAGNLSKITAHVVYSTDHCEINFGDEETITHRPNMLGQRGTPVCVYAIAHGKDGTIFRTVMSWSDVEKVRARSQTKDHYDSPWKIWLEQMAEKSCIHKLEKRIPTTEDLSSLFEQWQETETTGQDLVPVVAPPVKTTLRAAMGLQDEK